MTCATVDPNAQYSFQLYCTPERAMVLLKIKGWGLKVDERFGNLTWPSLYHIICDMKLVLDTDVLVAGLRSRTGASRRLLVLLYEGRFYALASIAMMLEYEAVLTRPDNLEAFHLTRAEVIRFLDSMTYFILPVTPFFLWRPQLRDPADEHVLETAINGGADAIVTFNLRHFQPAASRFGVDVIRPGEALRRIAQ